MGKIQTIWTTVIIAITIATSLLVWSHLQTYLDADHRVVTSREAQRRLYELTIVMQDTESSARGYMLTGQARHKQIFDRAATDIMPRIAAAQTAIQGIDRMQDFEPLKGLIIQRLELLKQMVALTAAGNAAQATQLLQAESTDLIGLSTRQETVGMIEYTNRLLEERLSVCRRSMMSMTRWVMTGLVALLVSGAALIWSMVHDIRRERMIAVELRRARDGALAGAHARDDFLNVLSHELRTPLTPALLAVSGMEKRSTVTPDDRADLGMVRRQLELEARLIDDLLDVNRILRGDVVLRSEQVSIHSILQHLCDVLGEALQERSLTVTCQLNAANDRVQGSESRLHQVFWHLFSNAIKFTPDNGTITITTSSSDGKIAVTITDTGIGMTEQQLPTIFEAFANAQSSRTRMFGGLGVGLAIVKSVVEMHQGTVTVHSEGKDKGASFRVELPVIPGV